MPVYKSKSHKVVAVYAMGIENHMKSLRGFLRMDDPAEALDQLRCARTVLRDMELLLTGEESI